MIMVHTRAVIYWRCQLLAVFVVSLFSPLGKLADRAIYFACDNLSIRCYCRCCCWSADDGGSMLTGADWWRRFVVSAAGWRSRRTVCTWPQYSQSSYRHWCLLVEASRLNHRSLITPWVGLWQHGHLNVHVCVCVSFHYGLILWSKQSRWFVL